MDIKFSASRVCVWVADQLKLSLLFSHFRLALLLVYRRWDFQRNAFLCIVTFITILIITVL